MYAKDEPEFEELEQRNFTENAEALRYVRNLCSRKEEWAIYCRTRIDTITRGHNTNNVVERAFLRLKDQVLRRKKCEDAIELAQVITTKLTISFESSLCDHVRNPGRTLKLTTSGKKDGLAIPKENIKQLTDEIFLVNNTRGDRGYIVNVENGVCGCFMGETGAFCKHQFAIFDKFGVGCTATVPVFDEASRYTYICVALGSQNIPPGFLKDPKQSRTVAHSVLRNVLDNTNTYSSGPLSAGDNPNAAESAVELPFVQVENPDIDGIIEEIDTNLRGLLIDLKNKVRKDPATLLIPYQELVKQIENKVSAKTLTGLASALSTLLKKESRKIIQVSNVRRKYIRLGSRSLTPGRLPANSSHEVHPVTAAVDNAVQVPSRKRKREHNLMSTVKKSRSDNV